MGERALLIHATFSCEGEFFAVGAQSGKVRIFSSTTEALLGTLGFLKTADGTIPNTTCLTIGPGTSPLIAAGSDRGEVQWMSVEEGLPASLQVSPTQQAVSCVCVHQDLIYVALVEGLLTVIDTTTKLILHSFQIPAKTTALTVAGKGESVYIALCSVVVQIVQLKPKLSTAMDKISEFTANASKIDFCWISDDAKTVVLSSFGEGAIRFFCSTGSAPPSIRKTLLTEQRLIDMKVLASNKVVVCTTYTGLVLVWKMKSLFFADSDIVPVPPLLRLTSANPRGRIISGTLSALNRIVLARGSFARPVFESHSIEHLTSDDVGKPMRLAFHQMSRGATNAELLQWGSTHGRGKVDPVAAVKDIEFNDAARFHVDSVKNLPIVDARAISGSGGISVPLYQALHAQDDGLVLELISMASRSEIDVARTLQVLEVPYLLQVIATVSKRLRTAGARHPLHRWIALAFSIRGMDLMNALQRDENADVAATVTPVLHQYRQYVDQRDKVATCFGRLSMLRSVRPNPNAKLTAHVFENVFTEARNHTFMRARDGQKRSARKVRLPQDMLEDDITSQSESDADEEEAVDGDDDDLEEFEGEDEEEEDEAEESDGDEASRPGASDGDEEASSSDDEDLEGQPSEVRDARVLGRRKKDVDRDVVEMDDF